MKPISILTTLLSSLLSLEFTQGFALNPHSFIVGGSVAQEAEFPFMARVLVKNLSSCGGFILSKKWIGTAAHCVVNQETLALTSPNLLQIIVGTNDNTVTSSKIKKVVKVVIAPGYSIDKQEDDLALLELDEELIFDERIQPIAISTAKVSEKQTFTAAGWGLIEDGTPSARLMQVDLITASLTKCRQVVPGFKNNNGPQICTDAETGKDTCPGDSGGPLFRSEQNGFSLYGITSYSAYPQGASTTCGGSDTIVGVYTHVGYYVSFISSTMGLSQQELTNPHDTVINEGVDTSNAATHSPKSYVAILSALIILLSV
ncbi:hypothetical protein K7432_010728 [Basidiobolus ranarum]|uniref:Peptidase S1 domain-containing protein n=1 Tax=Basidiobolus ranarum TaxID=34480 RepID=A0ABR2WN98_9FUNG